MKRVRAEFSEKARYHRVFLEDGAVCAMVTDPASGPTRSFQRLAKHRVPKRPKASGARWNWTIRTSSKEIRNGVALDNVQRIEVGEGLWLLLRRLQVPYLAELKEELLREVLDHGRADTTTVFGRTSDNYGRRVLEQAHVEGQTYTYSGKTTAPGRAFGPYARLALAELAKDFGVAPESLWAHLVYYPEAKLCNLGWHSDSESGINPHTIISVTFLADPVRGARPFDVRLKSQE